MLQRFINTNGIVYPMKYFPRVKDHDPCFPSASELLRSESPAGPFSLLSPLLSSLSSHPDSVASITKAGHASRPAVECRRNEVFHPPSFPSPPGGERNRGMWRGQISPVLRVWFVSRGRSLCKKERKRRGAGDERLN